MSKPKPVTELLVKQDSSPLAMAIQRGKKLQQLSRWVQALLDSELGKHCQVLNLRGSNLILAVDATVWATRLRYQLPMLLETLQQHETLKGLSNIQIRVKPASSQPAKTPRRRMKLSAESAYCLHQCAESISDAALSKALQRLATRRRN